MGDKQSASRRPRTADVHQAFASVSSLPSLQAHPLQQVQPTRSVTQSPYADDERLRRELNFLRKRNKELEQDIKKLAPSLLKQRELQKAYSAAEEAALDERAEIQRTLENEHEKERSQWQAEMQRVRANCNKRIGMLEQQQEHAMARANEEIATLRKQFDLEKGTQVELEREKRIELFGRQVLRRILHRDVTRGWTAWVELWEAKTYAMHRLRQAANRLRLPAIAHAFAAIAEEVERSRMRAEAKARRQLEAGLHGESAALSEEIKQIRVQYEAKLAFAEEDKKRALKMQLVELTGSSAEKQALIAQQMKEERIELLQRQIGRRMMNKGLSEAWTAWFEMWSAKTYAMQRLREVGGRLRVPEVSAAFRAWKEEVAEIKHQAELGELERQSRSLESQLRLAKFEAGQAQLVTVAQADEIKSLKEKLDELQAALRKGDGKSLKEEVSELRLEIETLRQEAEAAQAAEELAEQRYQTLEQDHIKQQHANQGLMQQLLAEQRRRFDEDTASMKRQLREKSDREAREERIEMLRRIVSRRVMNQSIYRGLSAWVELWQAKTYAMNRLRQVANRLRAPEKARAFQDWVLFWNARQAAKLFSSVQDKASLLEKQEADNKVLRSRLHEMEDKLEKATTEAKQLRVRVTQLEGGVSEAELIREQMAAKAREERIELLQRQIGRRMMNRGLSEAWTAWIAMREARTSAMGRLREIANRLHAPEKSMAFSHWQRDWQEYLRQQQVRAMQEREDALEGTKVGLELELRALRAEFDQRLKAETEKRAVLLQKLAEISGGEESMQALLEAQAEQAKDQRVELLRRQITRRMMNAGLTSAWTAWFSMWQAKTHAMGRLREVANRLHAPEKSMAFSHWFKDWQAAKEAALKAESRKKGKQLNEQTALIASLQAELHEARAVLQKAGLKRDDGRIDQTEVQRIREEMEAKAREERIELLRRQVGRRMMNKDLSEAWTAWFEMWSAKTYATGRLREIANRLRAPEKSMAFSHWQRDWQEYLKHQQIRAWKQREDALEGTTAALEQELKALRVEYEGKLRQAEEAKHLALERQLISLTGTAEERKAAVEEQAREERIELLRRQIGRRMLNRSLSRGWSAWLEMWEAKTYAMGRLRQVGNRFREPGMSRAFAFWVDQWVETRRAKEMKELKQQSKNLDLELNKARFEAGRLALIKIKHEDTIKELESKLRYQMEDLAIKTNMLEGLSLTRRQNDELKDLSTSNAEAAELNAARLQAIEDAAEKQRKEDQELLQRLLDEQRQALELSVKADHEKSKAAEAMMKRMEDEIKHERDDLSKQHKELRDENTKLKKELDKVKKQVEKLLAKKRESPVVSGALGKIDLDEGPDAPPVSQQIAAALRKNSARVLDLFREWDADGDGDVTLAEFRRAMPKLGLNVPQKDIDALFNEWDKDGGGALNLRELQKILRAPPPASKDVGVNKDIAPPSMAGSAKGAMALVKLGAMAKAFGS